MPRVIEKTVFQCNELSDKAKGRARDWFREGNLDYDWWDSVYADAETIANIIGIEFNQKPVKLMNNSTRYDPTIWFSGFSSQGDGACFEGRYAYAKGGAKAIRAHAPMDMELHRIADALQAIQRRHFYRVEARMEHNGRYYHSGCMTVDVSITDAPGYADEPSCADEIRRLMRDFADWIYHQLEAEHDYRQSDETVDADITSNEYEFDENGRRAC